MADKPITVFIYLSYLTGRNRFFDPDHVDDLDAVFGKCDDDRLNQHNKNAEKGEKRKSNKQAPFALRRADNGKIHKYRK